MTTIKSVQKIVVDMTSSGGNYRTDEPRGGNEDFRRTYDYEKRFRRGSYLAVCQSGFHPIWSV